jgi:hypothetical protein
MPFDIKTRYGHTERFDENRAVDAVNSLIEDLSTEQFEKPDDEHTQVAVGVGKWGLTAEVSGLLTLSNVNDHSELHLRATSRGQVREYLLQMARGDVEGIRKLNWLSYEQLPPPPPGDLFRL